MSALFDFQPGPSPLLISVPHDGRNIPGIIKSRMTEAGQSIPDTDWYVAKLYEFATDLGANLLTASYSRYVVDLNRAPDDTVLYPGQLTTGLCPLKTFAGESIYRCGGLDIDEKGQRIMDYWQPYHAQLHNRIDALRERHGYALLWDAHSIPSRVPRLFGGELPELNLGSNNGASCDASISAAVSNIAAASDYSNITNGRFKGGYITRHYGDPGNGVHALQLEIAQRVYMNEGNISFDAEKAAVLRDTLRKMLEVFQLEAQKIIGLK